MTSQWGTTTPRCSEQTDGGWRRNRRAFPAIGTKTTIGMTLEDIKPEDIGRNVTYTDPHTGVKSHGTISSKNSSWVFVRFHTGSTAAACDPRWLTF